MYKVLTIWLLLAASVFAQNGQVDKSYTTLQPVTIAPSGNCSSNSRPKLLLSMGMMYTCQSVTNGIGTWTAASGSFSAGVVSVNGRTGTVVLTNADVSLGNVNNTSDANKPVSTAQATAIAAVATQEAADFTLAVKTSQLGVASGVATLDSLGTLTTAQIPASLLSGLKWQGTWNASTNSPALVAGTAPSGYFYKVSTAGTQSVTGSSQAFTVGDWLIGNGTAWQYVANTFNNATTTTVGVVELAGDLSGSATAPTVAKLNGITAPSTCTHK
jgi:hypothetical protein